MTNQELNLAVAKACGAIEVAPVKWHEYQSGDLILFPGGNGLLVPRIVRGEGSKKYSQPWDPASDAAIAIECVEKLAYRQVTIGGAPDDEGGMAWCVILGTARGESYGGEDVSLPRAICLAIVGLEMAGGAAQ